MANASPAERVRAGMEMLAWTYTGAEWDEQMAARLDHLLERSTEKLPFPHSLLTAGSWRHNPAAWDLLERVRIEQWTSVLITANGLVLESRQIGRTRMEARLWRDERDPLRLVKLVSAGWHVLVLEFGEMSAFSEAKPRLVVLPIPERLRSDIGEIAEILWRKTLEPGDDDSSPPRWPDG